MHIGSGLGGIVLFISGIFWLGEHPGALAVLDFLFQLFLFYLLGKIALVPAFYFSILLKDWRIMLFGFSFMLSVLIRWMIVLLFDLRIGKSFPVVEYGYGIPYSLACAAVVYLILRNTPFVREMLQAAREGYS